ncbi:MAG: glycosyltransferase family 2 protein [Candidatus Nanoarchaeia archaeon]
MQKISVVVCTKNEEKYIESCLKALKRQIVKPEIIIVDGHSTDNTARIAKKYADKILKDNKKGLGAARNIGWRAASSDIIAFCDADAKPPRNWTKKILKAFEHKKVLGISGPLVSYDGDFHLKLAIKTWANYFPAFLATIGYHNCWGANMAFRKSTLEKYPFRYKFLEDYDMGERLNKIGGMRFISDIIMPISSRRFETIFGFYKVCLVDYIAHVLKAKITGKRSAGYYAKFKRSNAFSKFLQLR